jgi:hypothetical protein
MVRPARCPAVRAMPSGPPRKAAPTTARHRHGNDNDNGNRNGARPPARANSRAGTRSQGALAISRGEFFPFAGGEGFLDFVGGVEAVTDDGGAEIFVVHGNGL